MKSLFLSFIVLSFLLSLQVQADTYKLDKLTVIAIAEVMNEAGDNKNEASIVPELSKVLGSDKAINDFSQMMVELCLDPAKYDFPVKGVDKSECVQDKVLRRIQDDLSFTLIDQFQGEVSADQVESFLNNFLNTYLGKMKAVIEAFNSWS